MNSKEKRHSFKGIRNALPKMGKRPFHITIVPFKKDEGLFQLLNEAEAEAKSLVILLFTGDPDDNLEIFLKKKNNKVGPWTVNPYKNILISTHHPECMLEENYKNAPRLKEVMEYLEKNYLLYNDIDSIKWE